MNTLQCVQSFILVLLRLCLLFDDADIMIVHFGREPALGQIFAPVLCKVLTGILAQQDHRCRIHTNPRPYPLFPCSTYSPCLILSANFIFPNSHAFSNPCSLKSIFFTLAASCAGGRDTRLEMTTGSVSRMMPSSTISSMAREARS
jgi:hypothetical protein